MLSSSYIFTKNMDNNTNQPKATIEIQTDAEGNWEAQFPQDLTPGLHKIIVETEGGEYYDMALLNLQVRSEAPVETAPANYSHYLYPVALLTILVLILAVNNLRLMIKAKKDKRTLENRQRHMALVTVLAAVFSIAVFCYVAYQSGWFKSQVANTGSVQPIYDVPVEKDMGLTDVNGRLVDPVTDAGVSGMDMTVKEVNVRTQEGGAYRFSQIPSNSYIRLTHPELKKALFKKLDPANVGSMDVMFDVGMYNALMTVIDLESNGQLSKIYEQLPEGIKSKISEQDFINQYEMDFSQKDLSRQELVLAGVSRLDSWSSDKYNVLFDRAVNAQVEVANATVNYYLILENGQWKVIK